MKKPRIAVVGATGMVGRSFIKILEEKKLDAEGFAFFASARSAGKKMEFMGKEYTVQELTENSFSDTRFDIALFSAGSGVSKKYAPLAAESGCIVVDNSSYWRTDKTVPLVVPEVNPDDILWNKGIIANPNCVAVPATVALKPLKDKYGVKRVVYSTYQSVSGAGMGGWLDLERGLKGEAPQKFPFPIVSNCLPHIDSFSDDGYTYEEIKIIAETRKILGDDDLKITVTSVRVPVFSAHSISLNVELCKPFELTELVKCLEDFDGIVVQNDVKDPQTPYPMAINAAGKDEVFVGRIRRDFSVENGVNLWIVADNVRKGAALNAVQIAELLMKGM